MATLFNDPFVGIPDTHGRVQGIVLADDIRQIAKDQAFAYESMSGQHVDLVSAVRADVHVHGLSSEPGNLMRRHLLSQSFGDEHWADGGRPSTQWDPWNKPLTVIPKTGGSSANVVIWEALVWQPRGYGAIPFVVLVSCDEPPNLSCSVYTVTGATTFSLFESAIPFSRADVFQNNNFFDLGGPLAESWKLWAAMILPDGEGMHRLVFYTPVDDNQNVRQFFDLDIIHLVDKGVMSAAGKAGSFPIAPTDTTLAVSVLPDGTTTAYHCIDETLLEDETCLDAALRLLGDNDHYLQELAFGMQQISGALDGHNHSDEAPFGNGIEYVVGSHVFGMRAQRAEVYGNGANAPGPTVTGYKEVFRTTYTMPVSVRDSAADSQFVIAILTDTPNATDTANIRITVDGVSQVLTPGATAGRRVTTSTEFAYSTFTEVTIEMEDPNNKGAVVTTLLAMIAYFDRSL